jgi:hypothetical protein
MAWREAGDARCAAALIRKETTMLLRSLAIAAGLVMGLASLSPSKADEYPIDNGSAPLILAGGYGYGYGYGYNYYPRYNAYPRYRYYPRYRSAYPYYAPRYYGYRYPQYRFSFGYNYNAYPRYNQYWRRY